MVNSSTVKALEREKIVAAEKLLDETFGKGRASDYQNVQKLTQAERELLKVYFRDRIENIKRSEKEDDTHIADSQIMLDLALLDDDWAREQVVKAFWNRSRARASGLHYLRDPKIISMIGEGLFMEEETYQRGDLISYPTQDNIARVVIDTLANSSEFDADVINWARRVNQWSAEEGSRELRIVRDFYRANEDKLKAWNFKAVRPGVEPPDRNTSAPAGGVSSSMPPGSKPAPALVTFPHSVLSQERSDNVYACIAALLLVIVGGLALLLRRRYN